MGAPTDEIDLILSLIPTGPRAEKLRREPDPKAAAFIAAVDTDDELEVDADVVVSRGEDDGALAMSWIWVPAKAADISLVVRRATRSFSGCNR